MNKKLRAEIDYINMLLIHFLLFISVLFLFKYSFSNVLNGIINFKTQIAFLVGSIFVLLIIYLISSIEKSFSFKEKTLLISFVLKKIEIEYSEIEFLKFVSPPKSNNFILIQLKKRVLGRKSFGISIDSNNMDDILEVLNYLRSQHVPTGLNQIGEKYLYFSRTENCYFHRKDVKIDLKKLW